MIADKEREIAANNWNLMHVDWLIEYAENMKSSLELFESLGAVAADRIDSFITELEALKTYYVQEVDNG